MSVKRRYYQQCITPALLYGCESWALTKTAETRLARCQRALERQFLGSRRRDKRSSDWLRQRTKLKDVVAAYRTRKWRHAYKMQLREGELRWDTRLLRWTPLGKRPRGRPRTRYADDFRVVIPPGSDWTHVVCTSEWPKLCSSFATYVR
uniref:Reverse transcriptase n=1 Tax=Plectus sambesii TaxID=2011161 RepID=A0A914XI74_9BILA